MGRPPLGRARGGGLVAQGRGGRCVVSLDAFLSRGCEKARFGALGGLVGWARAAVRVREVVGSRPGADLP